MRVGIVGTNWGLMHVGGFRGAGAEVVALCGRDPAKTAAVAAREGIGLALTDVAELCRVVDLVVVAGPDGLHRDHVAAALEAGRPVLCEKPMATSEEDAGEMAVMARRVGLLAAVNFPYRTLPPVAALAGWLAGREIRWLATTVVNSFAAQIGPGSGDLGGLSHLIDTALWLAGGRAPSWVHAALGPGTSALQLGLAGGATLVITQTAAAEPGIHGSWVLGGDGWQARFAGGYVPARGGWVVSPVHGFVDGAGGVSIAAGAEPELGRREPWAEAHVATARQFLAVLAGAPPAGLASFEEGLAVQRVIAAAVRSASEGRRVSLPTAG